MKQLLANHWHRPFEGAGICDESIALELFSSRENFKSFHEDGTETDCFGVPYGKRPRLDDDESRMVATRQFGSTFAIRLPAMPKPQRDKALGLSVCQTEWLTGIGRNINARTK